MKSKRKQLHDEPMFTLVFLSLFSDIFCFLGCTGFNQGYKILVDSDPNPRRQMKLSVSEKHSQKRGKFTGPLKVLILRPKKWYKKVLIMISGGLKFGDGNTRIVIWLNVRIKLKRLWFNWINTSVVICYTASCTAVTGEAAIFLPFWKHQQLAES